MITVAKNTAKKFVVFKSSIDLSLLIINGVFLAKITYDTTKVQKVVQLTHSELSRMFIFELTEGTDDLENGVIEMDGFGHYKFELYNNDVFTSNISELTRLYTEKMKLI